MAKVKFLLSGYTTIVLLAAIPVFVLAQNNSLPSGVPPPPKIIPPESSQVNVQSNQSSSDEDSEETSEPLFPGTAVCFDYYRFQSVQVTAAVAEERLYDPGEEILFRGEVTNENKYPVIDGYVFARVGLVNSQYTNQGHNITDEFFAVERMALDAGAVAPIEFKWRVPKGAAPGEYVANYFFSVGKRFNLGGLPFSNEVIIGSTGFSVKGGGASGILFDRGGTTVNSKKYYHIGNWPVIDPGASVVILQPIKNLDKFDKEAKVTYELYYWDSLREEDRVAQREEIVQLKSGASKTLRYEIPKMDTSVYYLKINASTDSDSAIVNIRVVSDQPRPRINYPAITKFPITNGDSFTVFSCFHNTSSVNAEGNVSVLLSDREGNKISETSYNGVIPPDMLAIAGEVIAKKNYDYLKLHAEIKNTTGAVIDSYDTIYDCSTLKSSICDSLAKKNSTRNIVIIIGLVAVAVLAFIGLWMIRGKKTKTLTQNY